jgi:alpha-L-fucosidase
MEWVYIVMKKKMMALGALLMSLATLMEASPNRGEFPPFNRNNDLLLCQFDNRADADDLHSQAAVGSMMRHTDFEDVQIYAVLGSTGMQATDIIDSTSLMTLVFGSEGAGTWTDARSGDERIDQPNSRWTASVERVKNIAKPILQKGGSIWVMEAGQSHLTADWIQALQDDGVSPGVCQAQIYIVQHSEWNHKQNRKEDLAFVNANAQYIRIDDGNHDTNDRKQARNDTADYETDDAELDAQKGLRADAKTTANPDAAVRSFWKEADRIIEDIGFSERYSIIDEGGLDFSDTVEAWWIMELGDSVDTVPEFWERYVIADARMAWWQNAKFGMFIHWGAYSKAAGEWNGETNHGEWLQFTAKIPLPEYRAFAKTFNPVAFDADDWVRIARDAGMKYMVITAKHHDGFALFDSPCNPYNIVDASVYGRDPIKDLSDACAKEGMKFCVYYSLGRDWEDPDVPTGKGDNVGWRSNLLDFPDEDSKDFSKYFERKVKPQVRELLTQYGPIGVMWFDTPERITKEQSEELRDMIRTLQPNCIINNRIGHDLGDYGTPEQQIPSGKDVEPWETCMTISERIWGYNKFVGYRDADQLIRNLVDVASKGGNYLLNVGPTGEGIIPAPSVERLQAMGDWLKVNGEAIYGCGPTPFGSEVGHYSETEKDKHGKPQFISEWKWRATTQPGRLYIHCFDWPEKLELPPIGKRVAKARLLADSTQAELPVFQSSDGVCIQLPDNAPDPVASVICLELN